MKELYSKISKYAVLLNSFAVFSGEEDLTMALKARSELINYVSQKNGINGIYWWNVPIADVLEVIAENTVGESECDGWRFASDYKIQVTERGISLYIEEEGHFSNFSSSRNVNYETVSKYSDAEREQMVSNYIGRKIACEQWNIATTDGMVYSERYDKVYGSARDYYNSSEYLIDRQIDIDFYKSTLVDEKKTTVTTVYSNSLHYKALFHIADFVVDNCGNLISFELHNFEPIAVYGSGADYAGQNISNKNPMVYLTDYLINDSFVKSVGVDLLDRIFYAECSNYTEALHNAAAIANIGAKIKYVEYEVTQGFVTDDQAARCNALVQKVAEGRQLDENETVTLLNATINGGFKAPFENIIWLKLSLMYDLAVLNLKDRQRCLFYCRLCAENVKLVFNKINDINALKQLGAIAIVTSGICAEEYLAIKEYKDCFAYGDILEEFFIKLSEIDPFNMVFKKGRLYNKLIKKISKAKSKY